MVFVHHPLKHLILASSRNKMLGIKGSGTDLVWQFLYRLCPLAFVLPIPFNSCVLCFHPVFCNSSSFSISLNSVQLDFLLSFSLPLPHLSNTHNAYSLAAMTNSLMMINKAPAALLDVIFIAFLTLLREVNELRLISFAHEQSRAFQESVFVPGMYFSTHPCPDRTHVYQLLGHKCVFKPPIAWRNRDGISSTFNIATVLMAYLYSELPLCFSGALAYLLRLPLKELIWPNSDT